MVKQIQSDLGSWLKDSKEITEAMLNDMEQGLGSLIKTWEQLKSDLTVLDEQVVRTN